MTFKDVGITLRSENWGEADKRLTLLLEGRGKVYCGAKGARRPGSKYREACELFAFSEFVLYDGGGFLTVSSADLIEPFYGLRGDYDRYLAACKCAELVDRTYVEAGGREVSRLLRIALNALGKGRVPAGLAMSAFVFRYMRLEGFSPVLDGCSVCGGGAGGGHFGEGGLVCGECARLHRTASFSEGARVVLDGIINERVPAGAVAAEAVMELEAAAGLFVGLNYGLELGRG